MEIKHFNREDIEVKELPSGDLLIGMPKELWEFFDHDQRCLGFDDFSDYLVYLMFSYFLFLKKAENANKQN